MECLSDILANTFDAVICCTGEQHVIAEWNGAAERLFGIPADQVKGRAAVDLTGDPTFAIVTPMLRDALGDEAMERRRYAIPRTDGALAAVEAKSVRLPDNATIVIIAREQPGPGTGALSARLAHELRTPLTPVLMTAAALSADERLPADAREQLAMIERNVALQARLIDEAVRAGGAGAAGVGKAELQQPPPNKTADDPAASNGIAPAGPRLHLLLVEDHQSTLDVVARLLTRAGHQVVTARTLSDALSAAKSRLFDVVISDLGLPDGTGDELMKILRARYGLRGIALSGYGADDDVRRSRQAGFVAHLTKPVDFQHLERALAKVSQMEALR
ncbi:MAG: response regulator [Chthoniobacterales bacterium]